MARTKRELTPLDDPKQRWFWCNVLTGNPKKCWPWLLSTNEKGYGQVRVGKKVKKAHRVAFMLWHGVELAQTDDVHHTELCPHECCNPHHLAVKDKKNHNSHHMRLRALKGEAYRTHRRS
jgi:hypothetical protein